MVKIGVALQTLTNIAGQKTFVQLEYELVFYHNYPLYVINIVLSLVLSYDLSSFFLTIYPCKGISNQMRKPHHQGYLYGWQLIRRRMGLLYHHKFWKKM